jgi:hypothetical protein
MNGLRVGMSAPPLTAAAPVVAGVTSLTCQKRSSERGHGDESAQGAAIQGHKGIHRLVAGTCLRRGLPLQR